MSGDGAQHGSAADHRGPALPYAQTHPLALTLQRDGGSLLQGLTDMRAAGRLARVEVPDAALKEVRAAANADAHALGSRIFSAFLAAPIRDLLVTSAERPLYLQIDEQLMDCPWELAYDGTRFLGEKFAVARQIVLRQPVSGARYAPPVRDLLKVLLVVAEAEAARAQALQHHLDALPGVRVRTVDAGVVTSAGTLDALAGNHVVHWLGKEALAAAEIAVLRAPPEVIVLETGGGGAARASTLAGLNVVMTHAAPAEAELAFIERMYAELAAGEALGEAVRRARAVASARNDIAGLSAALYGDPLQALVSRTHALPEQDNRRQVTVLSCDIVGSTSLLKNLGAEAYSDLLHRYRTICASVVSHQGGYIEESKGDGILALFGFPVAHEDGAARALRAGEEIIAAVGDLDIAVRMGVATGPVAVAGGMPVGDVIHFTIRLQTNAAPNALLVSDTTRRIVGERFVLQPITAKLDLKGFDSPGPVYRLVAGGRAAESLESGARLTPFVGRSTELRYLERHWAAARTGSPRAILVSGDAGIGKSRLVREFTRAQAARRYQLIVCRCTPDHVASAFHPVIDFLRHTLDLDRDDSIEQKHESVRQAMAGSGIAGAATLIAALLSLPPRGEDPAQRVSAEKQRDQTLEALAGWVVREAAKGPLCVLIEDIHWIDPSTRELLVRLDRRAERLPLMIVATVRTEHRQPTILPGEVEEIELKGLSEDAAREMVVAASGDARLPRDVVGFLAQKADGVPLFIEESTRMMLDTRAGAEAAVLSALPFTVPATIHDVLMARLDRLSAAKPLAQLGGTIGREFSLSLIESVLEHPSSPIRVENLPARIDQLVESGLLVRKGDTAGANYAFKHALVRDAAYESLWERDRRRLHWTIATVLKERFGEQAETQPEVLAYHYTQAGTHTEAIAHWERAARRAASRSAHKEAISHLEEGLKLVAGMQSPGERDRLELRFQLLMAARLIATEGYGAERVERVYSRASELCSAVGDENSLLKVRLGLEGYHFMRADFQKAHEYARQAQALVARSNDTLGRLQSRWAMGNILFHQGEGEASLEHLDACLAEYQAAGQRAGGLQDPAVMCLCYSSWLKWQLGFADQALERARRVVAYATELDHPFSMAEAYGFCASVQHFRGEDQDALESARRAIRISEDGGFAVWLAYARLMHGRMVAGLGDAERGVEEMRLADEMWSATGAVVTRPYYLAKQAEGLGLAGRPDEALGVLETAYDMVRRYGERYYEAEIRRLIGEMVLQAAALAGRDRRQEGERWFLGALNCAISQKFRSLQLRAAMSLGRLWRANGRAGEAVRIIAAARAAIDEGRNTRDLREGAQLEEALQRICA